MHPMIHRFDKRRIYMSSLNCVLFYRLTYVSVSFIWKETHLSCFAPCSGFTNSNYPELTQLYQKYKDQGFEVLAFPCNQFGGQEPGSNEEIENFVCTRFKAEYPIFDKVDVNGSNAAPLYKFLKSSKGGFLGDSIKWNFSKFLVDKDGKVVDRYAPTTSPLSIEKDIKKLLGVWVLKRDGLFWIFSK